MRCAAMCPRARVKAARGGCCCGVFLLLFLLPRFPVAAASGFLVPVVAPVLFSPFFFLYA